MARSTKNSNTLKSSARSDAPSLRDRSEMSFRELEQQLDAVLARVEQASYDDLDELLKDHQEGTELIAALEHKLKNAKNTITKVAKKQSS